MYQTAYFAGLRCSSTSAQSYCSTEAYKSSPALEDPVKSAAYQYSVLCFACFGVQLHTMNKLDGGFVNNLLDAFCESKAEHDVKRCRFYFCFHII